MSSLLALCLFCAPAASAAPTPIPAGGAIPLDHWPFAPHSGPGEPALTPHRLDVPFTARCPSPWPTAPLPGPAQSGPWCVATTHPGPGGLLLIARPGERVIVLLPTVIEQTTDGPTRTLRRTHPGPPGPALTAAIRRWATGTPR